LSWLSAISNQDYAGIDKSKGENFVVTGTLTAAAIYAAIVGDGNPVDGLETIGQGNDPLTKVIAIALTLPAGTITDNILPPPLI
jgi:hypothetical protein